MRTAGKGKPCKDVKGLKMSDYLLNNNATNYIFLNNSKMEYPDDPRNATADVVMRVRGRLSLPISVLHDFYSEFHMVVGSLIPCVLRLWKTNRSELRKIY